MPPAARLTDMHTCPMVTPGTPPIPHVGGPISGPCSPNVIIGELPAARVTDMAVCVGPQDIIVKGSPTVHINGLLAARIGDMTAHGGVIVAGFPTVMIGDSYTAGMEAIVSAVNPANSVQNCGLIIDAVIDRLTGSDPQAVAPDQMNGSFAEIEQRHGMTMAWGHTFSDAFQAVRNGGNGTIAIVGIQYSGGTASHVVVMANDHGSVGILEGQNWGPNDPREVITTPERANARYNADGGSNVGFGLIPATP